MCKVEKLMLIFAVICSRQRTPLLLATFLGSAALFVGFKFRTMMTQSEAGKQAREKEGVNYSVVPGRSGILPFPCLKFSRKARMETGSNAGLNRWRCVIENKGGSRRRDTRSWDVMGEGREREWHL
jgi:hypothetical protein